MNQRQMVKTHLGALAVRVRGEGPVAVLWHSLCVDDSTWNRVVDDLARARRLVIITGPGHGASPDPERRYSMDECAEAAADVLAALGIDEPVDWVGNAWGGHVGIVFAARWPERCRTLVTLGTPIQSYTLSERLRIWVLVPVARLFGPLGFIVTDIRDVLLSPTTRAQDPEARRLVADCQRTMNRAGLVNAVVSTSLRRPDLTPRLSQIFRDLCALPLQRRRSDNDQNDQVARTALSPTNPTKHIEHDVAGLSGSPAISDNLMIATVPHNYLALPEMPSR